MHKIKNPSIHLLQVPSWLPTTCAHPKSASLPTVTAATVATTRTSVTSSPSFSRRTPASVSHPSVQLPSVQLLLIFSFFFSSLLYSSFICSSVFTSLTLYFYPHCSAALFLFCFSILSFLFLSLSSSLLTKYIPLPCLHCYPSALEPNQWYCTTVPECAYVSVFVCVPLKAVAELLLQIFDRKPLFHPALLHNNFN